MKNVRIPIIVAPMFLISHPLLAIECCKLGVIGSFPLANARPISVVRKWLETMSQSLNLDKDAPYAVNMIVHSTYNRYAEELELVKEFQPPIVITSLGDPGRVIDAVHAYEGLVFSDVNDIPFAKKAASKNVDGLILVSAGAGGHTGMIEKAAFIHAVKSFFDKKIIIAGGIMTGLQVHQARELGADFAYMGTRFINAEESSASIDYKKMMIESGPEDLVLTDKVSGVPAYFIKQSLINAGLDLNTSQSKTFNTNFATEKSSDAKAWRDIWSAGQGVGQVNAIEPAATIIHRLIDEYDVNLSS